MRARELAQKLRALAAFGEGPGLSSTHVVLTAVSRSSPRGLYALICLLWILEMHWCTHAQKQSNNNNYIENDLYVVTQTQLQHFY